LIGDTIQPSKFTPLTRKTRYICLSSGFLAMAADGGDGPPQQNGIAPLKQPHLLPPGWWVKNADGSFEGPKIQENSQSYINLDEEFDDGSETMDHLLLTGEPNATNDMELDISPDSDGWEDDGSPDVEAVIIHCLLCSQKYPEVIPMLDHCRTDHNFDLIQAIHDSKFDYYTTIRYINLIRKNVRDGVANPTLIPSSYELTQGEELLRPTLEDDALLYMIEDAVEFNVD
jgi:hypothetical protein